MDMSNPRLRAPLPPPRPPVPPPEPPLPPAPPRRPRRRGCRRPPAVGRERAARSRRARWRRARASLPPLLQSRLRAYPRQTAPPRGSTGAAARRPWSSRPAAGTANSLSVSLFLSRQPRGGGRDSMEVRGCVRPSPLTEGLACVRACVPLRCGGLSPRNARPPSWRVWCLSSTSVCLLPRKPRLLLERWRRRRARIASRRPGRGSSPAGERGGRPCRPGGGRRGGGGGEDSGGGGGSGVRTAR